MGIDNLQSGWSLPPVMRGEEWRNTGQTLENDEGYTVATSHRTCTSPLIPLTEGETQSARGASGEVQMQSYQV